MVKPWAGAGQQRAAHCLVLAEGSSYIYRTLSVKVGASTRSVAYYPRTKLYIKSPQVTSHSRNGWCGPASCCH